MQNNSNAIGFRSHLIQSHMTTAFGQFNAAPCKIKIKSNGDFIGSVITTRERERAKMNASVIEIARTLKCVRHIRCEQRVILLENLRHHRSINHIQLNRWIDGLISTTSMRSYSLSFHFRDLACDRCVNILPITFECISKTFLPNFLACKFFPHKNYSIVCTLISFYCISTAFLSILAFFWSSDAHSCSHFIIAKRRSIYALHELHFTAYDFFFQFFSRFTSSLWFLYGFFPLFFDYSALESWLRKKEITTEESFSGKVFNCNL